MKLLLVRIPRNTSSTTKLLCAFFPPVLLLPWGQCFTLPFFGLVSLPSLSSLSSRSLQRRTCSSLIFKKRILFCSSLRASSTSGSTHMSSRIFASILPSLLLGLRRPSGSLSLSGMGRVSALGYDPSFFSCFRVRFPFLWMWDQVLFDCLRSLQCPLPGASPLC